MLKAKPLIFCLSLFFVNAMITPINAQEESKWNGKKAAVALTYDDALNVHLDKVIPALEERGLLGTFYLTGSFSAMKDRAREWIPVSERGHELGNHTLFHPCRGDLPNREWVNPDYDLSEYTVSRMRDEIIQANILLETIDQKSVRTFAYPCGEMTAGGDSYVDDIRQLFVGARGVTEQIEQFETVNIYDISAFGINGQTGEELIEIAKLAMEQEGLAVFLFHGVGGEHNLNVALQAHNELLDFLQANEQDIWIAPLVDIATFVRKSRASNQQ